MKTVKKQRKRSEKCFQDLADEAAKHNINLAMESLRPQESQLVVTLADAKRMHDEVESSEFESNDRYKLQWELPVRP
ncbi:MAG: hypothetical protein ACLTC8_06010 [Lachnospiraceae bacterium]